MFKKIISNNCGEGWYLCPYDCTRLAIDFTWPKDCERCSACKTCAWRVWWLSRTCTYCRISLCYVGRNYRIARRTRVIFAAVVRKTIVYTRNVCRPICPVTAPKACIPYRSCSPCTCSDSTVSLPTVCRCRPASRWPRSFLRCSSKSERLSAWTSVWSKSFVLYVNVLLRS